MAGFVLGVIRACAALFVGLLLVVLVNKAVREVRERHQRRRRAAFEPKLLAYIVAANGRLADHLPGPFGRWERRVVELLLLEHIRVLRGAARERVGAAFDELGFVDRELGGIRSRRWWRRVAAAEKLGRMRSRRALPDLVAALDDPSPEVRIRAAKALGAIGGLTAVQSLIGALRDTNRWSALRIADLLAGVGSEAVEPVLEAFPGLPRAARVPAIDILGRLRSRRAVPLLRSLLRDRDADIRARAAHALGLIGEAAATPDLMAALRDSAWPVRAMAAKGLGVIPGMTSLEVLSRALTDHEWWVRANAAEALRKKGESGHQALVRMLDSVDLYAAQQAVSVLQESGVLDGYVERLASDSEAERRRSRAVLGRMVSLQRVDLLTDVAAHHADPRVRVEAGRLLQATASA